MTPAAGRRVLALRKGGARAPEVQAARPEALTAGFILSYALFWIVGLGFLWWPVLLLRTLRARIRGTAPHFLPSAVVACLALSLLWATLAEASLARVVSASYNLTIWITLALLTTVRIDVRGVLRGVAQLAGLQSVAVLVATAVYPALAEVRLPSSYVLPGALVEDPAFESFTTVRLVMEDYFGGAVLRAAGFFGNSTWAGVLAALGIVASVHLLPRSRALGRAFYATLLALDVVVLYLSFSRNTWVACLAALLAMAVVTLHRRRQWFALLVTATAGAGALLYVLTSVDLAATFEDVNSVRQGSLGSRTAIYDATWAAVQESVFPLLGSGVKERVPGLVASLGTHSGYLGILYRGGWLAVAALATWLVVLAYRSLRARSPLAVGSVVLAAIWFVAEDIDAGHLAPLALVIALAAVRAHADEEPPPSGARGSVPPRRRPSRLPRREPVSAGR